jgi:hypothetical protein
MQTIAGYKHIIEIEPAQAKWAKVGRLRNTGIETEPAGVGSPANAGGETGISLEERV